MHGESLRFWLTFAGDVALRGDCDASVFRLNRLSICIIFVCFKFAVAPKIWKTV